MNLVTELMLPHAVPSLMGKPIPASYLCQLDRPIPIIPGRQGAPPIDLSFLDPRPPSPATSFSRSINLPKEDVNRAVKRYTKTEQSVLDEPQLPPGALPVSRIPKSVPELYDLPSLPTSKPSLPPFLLNGDSDSEIDLDVYQPAKAKPIPQASTPVQTNPSSSIASLANAIDEARNTGKPLVVKKGVPSS